MRIDTLFGEAENVCDKKSNRITVSFSQKEMDLINHISNKKNISQSEVVHRLVSPTINTIKKQQKIIKDDPLSVAFDLLTKRYKRE